MLRCRIIRCDTAGCESKWRLLYRGISILVCLVCLSRLWCAATMFTKFWVNRALEKHLSLCVKYIFLWSVLFISVKIYIFVICAVYICENIYFCDLCCLYLWKYIFVWSVIPLRFTVFAKFKVCLFWDRGLEVHSSVENGGQGGMGVPVTAMSR